MTRAFVPSYLEDFRCDGPNCPDNCCQGSWRISVDELHFKRLRAVHDRELTPLIKKYVKRNRRGDNDQNYGKLVLDKKKRQCVFLTPEKFCGIQQKLGERHLCNVCMIYPRSTAFIKGFPLERFLSFSCPLAAKTALLRPQGIDFLETDIDITERHLFSCVLDFDQERKTRPYVDYFFELRAFTVQVLKTRDFQLWERLIVLGMFYARLQEVVNQGDYHAIPAEIDTCTHRIVSNLYQEFLADVPANPTVQMEMARQIIEAKSQMDAKSGQVESLAGVMEDFATGIGFDPEQTLDDNTRRYQQVYEQWYLPFMGSREYILENYLVNYVFIRLFPLTQKTLFDSYGMMVLSFALIKLLLIGRAGVRKAEFDETDVVMVIQKFVKSVEHNQGFVTWVYQEMEKQNLLTMAHMAILIKN
ncbi:lysine-N-methylase [Ectothiorhodospira magna]|uniref:Lysine-N-methylase n=1 Tax=Ectothiorhodospira magna TaxID=867345 RepID=A0A1H9A3L3_9GAMM|nr:flagellin lysine-N-methylase [Ectothiorhodospira magna]SEP71101.1 lysine-N-methylase [Ectothiorhodospira magna]